MSSKPVAALPEVTGDLIAAVQHYQSWRSDGKEHLLGKYEETIARISGSPDAFPQTLGLIQRAILKQSYYLVYFLQEPDRTLIIAVLDGRRDPREIRKIVRVRKPQHAP